MRMLLIQMRGDGVAAALILPRLEAHLAGLGLTVKSFPAGPALALDADQALAAFAPPKVARAGKRQSDKRGNKRRRG